MVKLDQVGRHFAVVCLLGKAPLTNLDQVGPALFPTVFRCTPAWGLFVTSKDFFVDFSGDSAACSMGTMPKSPSRRSPAKSDLHCGATRQNPQQLSTGLNPPRKQTHKSQMASRSDHKEHITNFRFFAKQGIPSACLPKYCRYSGELIGVMYQENPWSGCTPKRSYSPRGRSRQPPFRTPSESPFPEPSPKPSQNPS